jgi:polyisoprenoid-binding protein YceI
VRRLALAALLLGAGCAQAAPAWTTYAARSRLGFTATQAGGDFDGTFRRFDARIAFDPSDLAGSRFEVVIETGSADTGDADRDALLDGSEFFAVARWPTARFTAGRFVALADGRFEAEGELTLRDVTRRIRLPFTFRRSDDGLRAELAGGIAIRRLDYGVGQGEWRDTQWVGDEVRIRFELQLTRR